jgi:hypothetical protein
MYSSLSDSELAGLSAEEKVNKTIAFAKQFNKYINEELA